jgi:predicted MFS family arabinose efflux permease
MTSAGRLAAVWRGGPLSVGSFRLLACGQFTSTVGDYCYAVALPWLVLSTHGGAVLLGTVLACYGLPRTVLIPAGGLLTDKIGARTIMLAADTARCGLVVGLVVLATGHVASLALLGPVAALLGAGEGLFLPASLSVMPSLLEPEHLAAGNAINSAAIQAGSVAGPVLGGLLVATAGPAPAFAADAVSFAVSALSLALIRLRPRQAAAGGPAALAHAGGTGRGQPGGTGTHAGDGVWPLLRRARVLQVIVVLVIAANLAFGGTFEVALPALAHARFGAGGYGALMACLGTGAVIGTLTAARGGSAGRPALVASGSFLVEALAVALIPFLGGLPGAATATFVLGACNGMGNVVFLTLLQRWAPPRLLGRVISVIMLASLGSFPLSVAVSGLLVHRLGPSPFFPVAAATLAIAVLGAMSQREFRDFGSAEPPEAELGAESA